MLSVAQTVSDINALLINIREQMLKEKVRRNREVVSLSVGVRLGATAHF